MQAQWWQFLIFSGTGMASVLLAVIVGGWLVFKAKAITMPTPFLQLPQLRQNKPSSYLDPSLREDVPAAEQEEELSPAAARLRAQSMEFPSESGKRALLSKIRGGK